jgi:hypothetical protein
MKPYLAAAVTIMLGACAATDRTGTLLGSYADAPESRLVAELGPPASVDESGGIRYLSYRQQRSTYIPAVTPFYQPICPPSECVPLGGLKGFTLTEQCMTTFAVEDGKVKGWRREGKACGA